MNSNDFFAVKAGVLTCAHFLSLILNPEESAVREYGFPLRISVVNIAQVDRGRF